MSGQMINMTCCIHPLRDLMIHCEKAKTLKNMTTPTETIQNITITKHIQRVIGLEI